MSKYNHIFRFKNVTSDHFVKLFNARNNSVVPDYHMIVDSEFVEPVKNTGSFEIPNFEIISSYNAAKIIYTSLRKSKQPVPYYFNDVGMWEWLSYVFYEAHSQYFGELARYSPTLSGGKWNRHLLRTPVWLYEIFGNDSKIYLNKELHVGSDFVESWCQTSSMIEQNIMQLLTKLYFDDETQKLKPKMANKKPGDHRDLLSFVKQLRFTHIVEEMSAEELIELLPERFDKWKE